MYLAFFYTEISVHQHSSNYTPFLNILQTTVHYKNICQFNANVNSTLYMAAKFCNDVRNLWKWYIHYNNRNTEIYFHIVRSTWWSFHSSVHNETDYGFNSWVSIPSRGNHIISLAPRSEWPTSHPYPSYSLKETVMWHYTYSFVDIMVDDVVKLRSPYSTCLHSNKLKFA
jgi:hypothetical protein